MREREGSFSSLCFFFKFLDSVQMNIEQRRRKKEIDLTRQIDIDI
jgi:hypothetical protein